MLSFLLWRRRDVLKSELFSGLWATKLSSTQSSDNLTVHETTPVYFSSLFYLYL